MAIIKKKTWPELFKAIEKKEKKFDLRLNDFDVKRGDTLIFEEWDPKTEKYTGRIIEKIVGYVLLFDPKNPVFWKKEEVEKKGIVIMSLNELK